MQDDFVGIVHKLSSLVENSRGNAVLEKRTGALLCTLNQYLSCQNIPLSPKKAPSIPSKNFVGDTLNLRADEIDPNNNDELDLHRPSVLDNVTVIENHLPMPSVWPPYTAPSPVEGQIWKCPGAILHGCPFSNQVPSSKDQSFCTMCALMRSNTVTLAVGVSTMPEPHRGCIVNGCANVAEHKVTAFVQEKTCGKVSYDTYSHVEKDRPIELCDQCMKCCICRNRISDANSTTTGGIYIMISNPETDEVEFYCHEHSENASRLVSSLQCGCPDTNCRSTPTHWQTVAGELKLVCENVKQADIQKVEDDNMEFLEEMNIGPLEDISDDEAKKYLPNMKLKGPFKAVRYGDDECFVFVPKPTQDGPSPHEMISFSDIRNPALVKVAKARGLVLKPIYTKPGSIPAEELFKFQEASNSRVNQRIDFLEQSLKIIPGSKYEKMQTIERKRKRKEEEEEKEREKRFILQKAMDQLAKEPPVPDSPLQSPSRLTSSQGADEDSIYFSEDSEEDKPETPPSKKRLKAESENIEEDDSLVFHFI